jgi:SpoVK/Ycf46/Vps4 family AAA+-type ATPase
MLVFIVSFFSDLTNLAREAAFGPLREVAVKTGFDIRNVPLDEIRPISIEDFENALTKVRTSIDKDTLSNFEKWNVCFGDVS